MSENTQLIEVIADAQADALMLAKTSAMARGEVFTKQDLRACLREVLTKHFAVTQGGDVATPAEQIYAAYPRHVGKKAALKAIAAALKDIPAARLLATVVAYKQATDQWPAHERAKFIPHPATWFNRGSYADDPREWQRGAAQDQSIRTYDRV